MTVTDEHTVTTRTLDPPRRRAGRLYPFRSAAHCTCGWSGMWALDEVFAKREAAEHAAAHA